ncbi:MAG: precorrin-3B synthase [Alphaproteobacteria bacterium]|nr:precorrin-3B synthase [Alphaproteobacteria bacterium]
MNTAPRPSACPGLFRIVAALDGGLCRLKVPLGRLSAAGAQAIAEAARQHGNGTIEITNRANLQLRGILAGAEAALAAELIAAGLGPRHPESDDVRNVLISPIAGLDPQQRLDVGPIATDILAHVETDAGCRTLSPKFSVLVDGGESVAVVDHPHDIWLAAMDSETFALGIAGCPPVERDSTPFLAIASRDAGRAIASALALFLEEAGGDPEITRIRHLLGRLSREAIIDRLSKPLGARANLADKARHWRRPTPAAMGHVGVRAQRQEGLSAVGAVPPLGRLSPDGLAHLADLADENGSELRLTPWQSVMIPDIRQERAVRVVEALESLGFVCEPGHPLAAIVACVGSAGCAKGRGDTKADAMKFSDIADRGFLHLSGCERSCAAAGVADMTLLASAPGVYDLFVKDPREAHRFGRRIAVGLSAEQARERMRPAQ